ncbi:MAG: hypothetical protein GF418_02570 [Chitinivibrionales bacterium]|nr:hypothetical protein [Chitinivibrionales bacterium]MBD3394486.1 hypothetical protein [Chitinivibrionales bacterium]
MIKQELIRRSPLRILEKSAHGGVGTGGIGMVVGHEGVGKTACLVHIATDQLLQNRHVIHVSFKSDTDHIMAWYDDIFGEIAGRHRLDHTREAHEELVRNRVVMNFKQDGLHWPRILRSVRAMIEQAHFNADTIVVDGFDFGRASPDEIGKLQAFAREMRLAVWFSMSTSTPLTGVSHELPPELRAFEAVIDLVVLLVDTGAHIRLYLVKDHGEPVDLDTHLELDPKSLLIASDG